MLMSVAANGVGDAPHPKPYPKPYPQPESGTPQVLVIEDDRLVRAAVLAFLEGLGYRVMAVGNAEEALALTDSQLRQPRLLLCDYGLPDGVNGLQLIVSLRRKLGHDITACLMTGRVSSEVRSQCHEIGVPVLYKPVSPGTLRAIVQEACA